MPRTRLSTLIAGAALAATALVPTPAAVVANDDHDQTRFSADLISFNEVPSISSTARGTFRARLNDDGDTLHYKLTFTGLSGPPTQAHIHFGQRHTNGGIVVWLCATQPPFTDPSGQAPLCPNATSGTVEDDITALNVIQPGAQPPAAGQGIAAGEFDELLKALRVGSGYANIHTAAFGGGEIRGQIQ